MWKGAEELCIPLKPPCAFALVLRLTQVCLTSTKELAGLSKLELGPAHSKINLIRLHHKTA